jgi:histidyl-tRNA synthetase
MPKKFELQNAKGVRNFLPEEKIPRQRILDLLKEIFEMYGYSPLETPALERYDLLSAKFAGGSEITKEIFRMKDQGGRKLGLIYDLTVPMCKVVGMNPNLNMPFKRYQIQRVWRDGPVKLGRYREFWQCDVDVVGVKSMIADAEILSITNDVFERLGLDFVIKVNSRKLMNGILEISGIRKNKMEAILSIDKLSKVGVSGVEEELGQKGFEQKQIKNVLKILKTKGGNYEVLEKLEKIIKNSEGLEGIKELKELMKYVRIMGFEVKIDISLARGLEYYTGPVFEVYLRNSKLTSSLAGGGRYDKMIGMFLGKGDYPATGISFGIEPIYEALKEKKGIGKVKTVTKVFVIPIGKTFEPSLTLAKKLRESRVRTEIDLLARGLSKNLKYANSLGIPYVLFVGEKELKQKKVKLRDMKTGKEKLGKLEEILKELKV